MKLQALQNVTNAYKACESDMSEFDAQNAFLELSRFFWLFDYSCCVEVYVDITKEIAYFINHFFVLSAVKSRFMSRPRDKYVTRPLFEVFVFIHVMKIKIPYSSCPRP